MFESRSALHPHYVPSRFELEHLARVWWEEYYDVHFYCYVCEQVGGTELNLMRFATERLNMLKVELAEECWEAIAVESEKQFGTKCPDQETWQKFLRGQSLEEEFLTEA